MTNEKEIDNEVRIRLLERIAENIDKRLDHMDQRMEQRFTHLDTKMNNQFLWTLGIMITLFGGIILHSAKLI